jgi:hypothetical protein
MRMKKAFPEVKTAQLLTDGEGKASHTLKFVFWRFLTHVKNYTENYPL